MKLARRLYDKFSTSMKNIVRDAARSLEAPPFPPGFAPMLIEFPKNISKSRDKSYPTDQKTSSILVLTLK